jgi:hypothetical protein
VVEGKVSVVIKNPGTEDKKIAVATIVITEYTVPAGESTTIPIKSGDTIILE